MREKQTPEELKEKKRAHYRKHRTKNIAIRRARQKVYREWINSLKVAPCQDCGGVFPPVCMDFDHRPGEVKIAGISAMVFFTKERVNSELAKCDLVCSNCHRIRTNARQN